MSEHPYPVCEALTLRGVQPPPLHYALRHESENVSPMQRETAGRIMQSLLTHGFFIMGDGTGVGKGRTIALLVAEWLRQGTRAKAIWVSANANLQAIAIEELDTIGCDHSRCNFAFTTYCALGRKYKARTARLLSWCEDADSILVALDECHALRNKGQSFVALDTIRQALLGKRLATIYASATAMSSPAHLDYLPISRALVGQEPFRTVDDLHRALESGGAAFMELVCMHLKSMGLYCARQLSMEGVCVRTLHVTVDAEQRRMYDESIELLTSEPDDELEGGIGRTAALRAMLGFMVSCKMATAMHEADEVLARGETVIFSLVTTGDAQTAQRAREEAIRVGDVVARGPRTLLAALVHPNAPDAWWTIPPIDLIVDRYGPDAVAEITGRKRRLVREGGSWTMRKVPHDDVRAFTDGRKRVAILSRAGGLGISLHDTGVGRRTVIALELPWSSEAHVQQLGRVHRTSNVTAPAYLLISLTGVYAEQRIAQTLLRRTEALGALMHGDRDAWDTTRLRDTSHDAPTRAERRSLALRIAVSRLMSACVITPSALAVALKSSVNVPITRRAAVAELTDAIDACDKLARTVPRDNFEKSCLASAATDMIVYLLKQHRNDLAPAVFKWSPANHALFGPDVGRWVRTVLMVHAHDDARSTLGMLPHEVLNKIIGFALDESNDVNAVQLRVPHARLPTLSVEEMFNQVVLMPVDSQSAMERLLHHRGWLPRHPESRPCHLLSYIKHHISGNTIDAFLHGVSAKAAGLVDVVVRYAPREVEMPSDASQFVRHARSGLVGWMRSPRDEVAHGANGVAMHVDHYSIQTSTLAAFEEQRALHRDKAVQKCARLPSTFTVSTVRALYDWARSLKVLVRFDNPCTGAFTTGVLVKYTR